MTGIASNDPEYDTSQEYVVTYPSGAERVLWGEAAAVNEVALFAGSSYQTRAKYDAAQAKAAKADK